MTYLEAQGVNTCCLHKQNIVYVRNKHVGNKK